MHTLLLSAVGSVLAILAGATCVAAGVYMLSFHPAFAPDVPFAGNPFEALQHGLAIYAIGQGVSIWGLALIWTAQRRG